MWQRWTEQYISKEKVSVNRANPSSHSLSPPLTYNVLVLSLHICDGNGESLFFHTNLVHLLVGAAAAAVITSVMPPHTAYL